MIEDLKEVRGRPCRYTWGQIISGGPESKNKGPEAQVSLARSRKSEDLGWLNSDRRRDGGGTEEQKPEGDVPHGSCKDLACTLAIMGTAGGSSGVVQHHKTTRQLTPSQGQPHLLPPCFSGTPAYLTAVVLKEAEERVEM